MARALALLLLLGGASATAQQSERAPILPQADSSDDIVVSALRIPRDKLPTQVHWSYPSMLASKIDYEDAAQFMRCAGRTADAKWVRKVVDGEPNSAAARFAQGWIIQTHGGCYPPGRGVESGTQITSPSIIDRGNLRADRAALVQMVIDRHAPDAALTPVDIAKPDVRDRFQSREGARNRMRLDADQAAFRVANCLVQDQPVLATRMVRAAPGSDLERGLVQTILVDGRGCLGGVKRLTIDQLNFRYYIVDAFYRWVVAARGVDSLIPADAEG